MAKQKQAAAKTIVVKQIGSPIRRPKVQRQTLIGLGLNKMHRTRELPDTPSIRGMVAAIPHLVTIVEERGVADRLKRMKALYIACGDVDQYNLVYGARRVRRRLEALGVPHRYEEFPDDHSSVDYRMDVSLPYIAKALAEGA